MVFVHDSDGGTPTIITAPLQVTDIELQRGERLNEIVIGDTARWQIDSGTHGDTAHIFVKPIDSALETNAVVTTDRRVYHFKLLSRQHDYGALRALASEVAMFPRLKLRGLMCIPYKSKSVVEAPRMSSRPRKAAPIASN